MAAIEDNSPIPAYANMLRLDGRRLGRLPERGPRLHETRFHATRLRYPLMGVTMPMDVEKEKTKEMTKL